MPQISELSWILKYVGFHIQSDIRLSIKLSQLQIPRIPQISEFS
jgi:hypothetical protein